MLLQRAPDGGDGRARAHARGERVDAAPVGGNRLEELRGRLPVRLDTGGIGVRIEQHRALLARQLLRALSGAGDALLGRRQLDACPIARQRLPLLERGVLGNHRRQGKPALGRDHRQAEGGVAAAGHDERRRRREQALFFGPVRHRKCHAVVHRGVGREVLELEEHRSARRRNHPAKPHRGRAADRVEDGIRCARHRLAHSTAGRTFHLSGGAKSCLAPRPSRFFRP